MNMVEEWVVTLGFNKKNPKKFLTPCGQQSQGLLTKVKPPHGQGEQTKSRWWWTTSYLMKQSREDNYCKWRGFHKKQDCPNPPQATSHNLQP